MIPNINCGMENVVRDVSLKHGKLEHFGVGKLQAPD